MGRLSFGFDPVRDMHGLLFQVSGCFWVLTLIRDWNKSTSFWSLYGRHLDLGLLLPALIYWLRLTHQITVHFLTIITVLIVIFMLCIYREINRGKGWSWCHRSSRGWQAKAFTCWRKLMFIYSMWETFYNNSHLFKQVLLPVHIKH